MKVSVSNRGHTVLAARVKHCFGPARHGLGSRLPRLRILGEVGLAVARAIPPRRDIPVFDNFEPDLRRGRRFALTPTHGTTANINRPVRQ
jgi:hypothetical protein